MDRSAARRMPEPEQEEPAPDARAGKGAKKAVQSKRAKPAKAAAKTPNLIAKTPEPKTLGPKTPAPTTRSKPAAKAKAAPGAKPTAKKVACKSDDAASKPAKSAPSSASTSGRKRVARSEATATPPAKAPAAKPIERSAPPKVADPAPAPSPDVAEARQPQGEAPANPFLSPEVETFAANMSRLWEAGAKAMAALMQPRQGVKPPGERPEIVDIARTIGHVVERWASNPDRVAQSQREFTAGFLELWSGSLKRFSGEAVEPTVRADPKDGRFKDPEWTEHPVFDFIKQAYLHTSRFADRIVDDTDGLDPHLRHKASFYVKLLSNAASPSNFLPTNPELIRETLASKGENLVRGMTMLAEDIEAGGGDLRIRQTDVSGFEVGRNIATTPGKVVFRNELFELVQYAPATEMARTRPVVIVPPWINKFYVLDLNAEKSLIRWAVEQSLTVFCISWVNPDARHAAYSFDDYMKDGIMQAVDVAREICGTDAVDAVGYCVGGTLLSVTLAYMAATGDRRIAGATLLTTQVDFTEAGDLMVFVDEEQIAAVEAKMAQAGYLEGASMANAFNMIRANDMIFPYIVNNYLKGKAPFPFDLLYWNSDATRMPAANHSFYLRSCYLNNDLARGCMEVKGETLDLSKVTIPIYELAAKEDHIAPAKSVFLGAQLFGGPVRFVLAGSGHIAGVVNPPAKIKYQHWTGGDAKGELKRWLDGAEEKPGSWWPDWRAWLAASDATMVTARVPGEGKYEALEDAPGSYVKVRS